MDLYKCQYIRFEIIHMISCFVEIFGNHFRVFTCLIQPRKWLLIRQKLWNYLPGVGARSRSGNQGDSAYPNPVKQVLSY